MIPLIDVVGQSVRLTFCQRTVTLLPSYNTDEAWESVHYLTTHPRIAWSILDSYAVAEAA